MAYEPGVTGPPGTWQAKVFLAYASEDRKVALAVQEAITEGAIAEGDGTITVVKWDVNARDNVVFESGLFIGMKKADHAIILLPKNYSVEPSDLHGILGLKYPYDELRDNAKDHRARVNLLDGVGADIVDNIRKVMTSLPRTKDNQRRNTRNRLRGRGNL